MALLPTKQRDQIMVLISAVVIALTAAYFVYVWQPKSTELADLQAHVDTVEEQDWGRQVTMTATVERDGGDKPVCVAEVVFRFLD